MRSSSRLIAAAVGGLVLLFSLSTTVRAQQAASSQIARVASLGVGSIAGVVQDEQGAPIVGAMVSAFGVMTAMAASDRVGRFELRGLAAGPYLIRAHVSGYVASRGQIVDVRSSARTASSIALRRVNANSAVPDSTAVPVLAAAVGVPEAEAPAVVVPPPVADKPDHATDDDHGEVAWRLRHVRRGVLRDVNVPTELLTEEAPSDVDVPGTALGRGKRGGPYSGFATNLFAGMPLTGQFNLLTTGSFDSPQQLFAGDGLSHGIADVFLTAPVGEHADWSMRGALTQGDISSWFVAGAYTRRAPDRHRYDVGLSYSTQRYDGGNPVALRSVSDGSRNVGAVYGFDTFAVTSSLVITYGARFSQYDYLTATDGGLLSPRVEVAFSPAGFVRLKALASSRGLAPGAEEFLPPSDFGLWLPPQRTFSSLVDGRPLEPERTNHVAIEAEHDFGASTLSFRVFRQQVADQLVTMFGLETPAASNPQVGHYFVGNDGNVDANGWSAKLRTTLLPRVHASAVYSLTNATWSRSGMDTAYLLLLAPSMVRPTVDRVHGVSTSIETNVPETSTRVLVMYRFSSARPTAGSDRQSYDSRFDMQVHQSLPFMDFSTARWEMLFAVRNTFRDMTPESSVYDELLVSRPPKQIIGGLTLRF